MMRPSSYFLLLGAAVFFQACSSQRPIQDGTLDCEGLTRLSGTSLGGVCVQTSSAGAFRSAIIEEIEVGVQPVGSVSSSTMVGREARGRYQVGPQEKAELTALAVAASERALATVNLASASDSGSGVLRLRGQILDLVLEAPEDPQSGAKYLLDTIARATLVVELYDSETDALLLRAFDHRATKQLPPGSEGSAVSRMAAVAGLWEAVLVESLGYLPK